MDVTMIAPGVFVVESSSGAGCYKVDLNTGVCGCPHFTHRLQGTGLDCKHLAHVRKEQRDRIWNLAATVPTEQLDALLAKHKAAGRWDVVRALWCERWDRQEGRQ